MRRSYELIDPRYHYSSSALFAPVLKPLPLLPLFFEEDEIEEDVDFALDLLTRKPDPFNYYPVTTDLIRFERTPSPYSYKRLLYRAVPGPELWLEELSDRVSALEARFDRAFNGSSSKVDRKYTWTAEIKGEPERKYKWMAEIKGVDSNVEKMEMLKKKRREEEVERKYRWTAEIEGKDDRAARKYTIEVKSGGGGDGGFESKKKVEVKEKEKKSEKKQKSATRIVEIEDSTPDHGTLVLRQVFDNDLIIVLVCGFVDNDSWFGVFLSDVGL